MNFLLYFLLTVGVAFSEEGPLREPVIILDMGNFPEKPRNFRSAQDQFIRESDRIPSREGLNELRISGSAQFSDKAFDAIIHEIPAERREIIDMDLRQESHGFVDGSAVSWYAPKDWINKWKPPCIVAREEKQLLEGLKNIKEIAVKKVLLKNKEGEIVLFDNISFSVRNVATEEDLVKEKGIRYERIQATDHVSPGAEVNYFIQFMRTLPKNAWLHFHCAAGSGRTTTYMCIVDMLKNAGRVSFDDILLRQYLIGGADLTNFGNPDQWRYPLAKERLEFLRMFYEKARYQQLNECDCKS